MNWNRIKAIIKKDLKEVFTNKMVVLPMMVVPALLCVVIPGVMIVLAHSFDMNMMSGTEMVENLIPFYPVPEICETLEEKILFIFINYTFLPFFLIVPVMAASIIAANGFVGEKERNTLETLLYTPVTNRELMMGKQLSALLPALVISFVSFILFFVVGNLLSYFLFGYIIVRALVWIPAMLLLNPAISVVGLGVTLITSQKAKTFMEAQQMSALVVIPIILLVVVQITGVFVVKILYVVILAVALFIFGGILVNRVGARFNREALVS